MIHIDFDKQTHNTVAALEAHVTEAQSASDTAKAASNALTQRLSVFSNELDDAQARLSTAKSDKAAADAAEQSVDDALLEALKANRQALIIYASARRTLELAETAAQQTLVAGYDVAETLSYVTTASAKNSFITRKLLAAAEQADADASAAVSAAVSALRGATDAFIATELSACASFLVVASLVNLQRLMSGYEPPLSSNEDELPSALFSVSTLKLSGLPTDIKAVRDFDKFLLRHTPALISSVDLDTLLDKSPLSADLLKLAVDAYMKTTGTGRKAKVEAFKEPSATLPKHPGLQPGFESVQKTAQAYETLMQEATTRTQKAATEASQDQSRKAARLQTAQNALSAAMQAATQQAAGT
jgi:trimeric autotransporter adhesin